MAANWESLTSVQKGKIGEKLVNEYLISKGFIPYSPDAEGAHPFDRLVASRDKKTIFIADAKTKPARVYYPDTGINVRHYQEYKFIQDKYNIDVYLFFVDEDRKEIYGNLLSVLDQETTITHMMVPRTYPREEKGIRYFPLVKMEHVVTIESAVAALIKKLSGRKDDYDIIAALFPKSLQGDKL